MLENSERSVRGVRMGKSGPLERAELANQIQGFRIRTAEMLQKKKNFGRKSNYFHLFCLYRCMYFIMQNSRSLKEALDSVRR